MVCVEFVDVAALLRGQTELDCLGDSCEGRKGSTQNTNEQSREKEKRENQ